MTNADHAMEHAQAKGSAEDKEFTTSIIEALGRLRPREKARLKKALKESRDAKPEDLTNELERVINSPGNIRVMHGAGLGASVSVEDGRAAIDLIATDELSEDWARSELLGVGVLTERLHVTAATVANWRSAGHVVAFRRDRRNFFYPVRQFKRGLPTTGISEVTAYFDSVEDAWEWLVSPNVYTAGQAPIDRLQADHRDEVLRAAEGALDFA